MNFLSPKNAERTSQGGLAASSRQAVGASERGSSCERSSMEKREASGAGNSMMRMLRGSQGSASSSSAGPTGVTEFTVTLDNSSGSSLGMSFDPSTLVVTSVEPEGLVATWNAAHPGRELKVGHQIVQANGKAEASEVSEQIKAQDLLEIRITREASSGGQPEAEARSGGAATHGNVQENISSPCSSGGRSLKAWVADVAVASEETPPPSINNLKSQFDASSEFCASGDSKDGKDGDLVELPSPSIHTSLLTNSLLAPHETISCPVHLSSPRGHQRTQQDGREPSRTSRLSPGELVALREMAVEAASSKCISAPPGLASQQTTTSNNPAAAPSMWSVSSTGSVSGVQESTPAFNTMANTMTPNGGGDSLMQANARSPSSTRTPAIPPDDNEGRDIAQVHSSLATSSPSLHNTLRHDGGNGETRMERGAYGQEAALFSGMAVGCAPKNSNLLREQFRTHGSGNTHAAIGFLGAGPFWTCGSTPHSRQYRSRQNTSDSHQSQTALSGILRGNGSPAVREPLDVSTRISNILTNCINMMSNAIDVPDEPEPPEDELTTVLLETKEQRLQWRDFLSEAVSKCRANALFTSYDVEADPPRYARPPLSTPPKVDAIVKHYRQAGKTPPRIVAPNGAGWSPIGPRQSSEQDPGHGEYQVLSSSSMAPPGSATSTTDENASDFEPRMRTGDGEHTAGCKSPVLGTGTSLMERSGSTQFLSSAPRQTSAIAVPTPDLETGVGLSPSLMDSGLGTAHVEVPQCEANLAAASSGLAEQQTTNASNVAQAKGSTALGIHRRPPPAG